MTGPLGYYRKLLQLEADDFAVAVLDFDPFALLEGRDAFHLALAMLTRLLKRAQDQLEPKEETDGWDDLDLGNEASPKQEKLQERLSCQLRRLQVLEAMGEETFKECSRVHDLGWSQFRDLEVELLFKLARLLAAKGEISALKALMKEEELKKEWPLILEVLPETLEFEAVKALLPEKGLGSWCVERAMKVVKRTGLCRLAMELLEHAICELQGLTVDRKGPPSTEHLPELQAGSQELREVCCMFCLCQEYDEYLYKSHQEMLDSGWPAEQPPAIQSLVRFPDFCQLPSAQRLSLLLKYSGPSTVVADLKAWQAVSVSCEGAKLGGEFVDGVATLGLKSEEALVNALLGRSGGWDPEDFRFLAQVALASSPALPRSERILKDHALLMRFIFQSIYSEDQRCRAVDIFESVDAMYGCIPKADSDATGDSSLWDEFQRQADELEKHLTCLELLSKHKIKLSLSFADLRSACRNESRAVHSVWNLFRVLGAHYRPALFWRSFQQELFYLHQYAFAAMPINSVYEMYVRCLVDQDHAEVLSSVVEAWTSCSHEALGSLLALARELVNSSPSLHHASLEKASRLLKCADSRSALEELDFIRCCELLYELLARKRKRDWMSAMQNAGEQVAQLSEITMQMMKQPREREIRVEESFCMDTPLQLRLRLLKKRPLEILRELFDFNPGILLEEEMSKFCKLIHLPAEDWSDFMMLCSSAHLVCGDRREALQITEQLVAKGHPKAWKLAVALVEEPHLLADAVKVCCEEDLLNLMEYLEDEPLAEPHFEGLPMDLDLTLEEAWSLDVEAAASTLVSLAEPSDFSLAYHFDEGPEMGGGISKALQSLCEAYPDLVLGEDLEAQLMALAARGDALSLARAVTGVPELLAQGITASSIALAGARSFSEGLAPLVFLLSRADAVRLLELAVESSSGHALELVALLRCREELRLNELLRQVEAVVLLKGLGHSAEISSSSSMEEMKPRWLAQMDSELLPIAKALLDTGF